MSTSRKPARSWLPWAAHHDLSRTRGNGPMTECYGVVLHVNESEQGTSVDWFSGDQSVNPESVTPTFQVYKDGSTVQFLPIEWSPWCQIDGNWHYGAVETAGLHTEPLTPAQVHACARIMAAYHRLLGVPLKLANSPGKRGLGTHAMGGAAWGGHPCPGDARTAQRADILAVARRLVAPPPAPAPAPTPTPTPAPAPDPAPDPAPLVNVDRVADNHGRLVALEHLLAGVPGYVPLAQRPHSQAPS